MARVQIHCSGGHCLNKSEMQHARENPELVETVRVLAGATVSALVRVLPTLWSPAYPGKLGSLGKAARQGAKATARPDRTGWTSSSHAYYHSMQ